MGRCDPVNFVPDVFSLCTKIDDKFTDIYCCNGIENKFIGYDQLAAPDLLFVANGTCQQFTFPLKNDEDVPMLKSVLNSTAQSPWVRVAFQEYCEDGTRAAQATNNSIITTGNVSMTGGGELETCNATISAFQYGWGLVNNGDKCRITIIDEKGGSFETWAKRISTNTEGISKPVIGSYKMKVQFGWYITGGGPDDQCGQVAAQPGVIPDPGQNTSFNICSPTMWFMPNNITANWQDGKFIYVLEGNDLVYRSQNQSMAKINGHDGGSDNPFEQKMYFTEAVQLLGAQAMPPFRVRFLAVNSDGDVTAMKFIKRGGISEDHECLGPFDAWRPYERTPLAVIQSWLISPIVQAIDQTGTIQTDNKAVGIFMNYDPTQDLADKINDIVDFPVGGCEALVQGPNAACVDNLPDVGTLILWTGSAVPQCQGNIPDDQIDKRMKAVYIVGGGNCSPVISFNPEIRWSYDMGIKAGGTSSPVSGTQIKQTTGSNATGCAVSGGRGPRITAVPVMGTLGIIADAALNTSKSVQLQVSSNIVASSINAELRVQGDPSYWLCGVKGGTGKFVGIIFINPFFLQEDAEGDCPQFRQTTCGMCNNFLTNKGWCVDGADHQIKDGSFITTLKLRLPAPGAELKFNSLGVPTGVGAWGRGSTPLRGGTNAAPNQYPIGSEAVTAQANLTGVGCTVCFTGGGSACDSGAMCDTPEGRCENGDFCDGVLAGNPAQDGCAPGGKCKPTS